MVCAKTDLCDRPPCLEAMKQAVEAMKQAVSHSSLTLLLCGLHVDELSKVCMRKSLCTCMHTLRDHYVYCPCNPHSPQSQTQAHAVAVQTHSTTGVATIPCVRACSYMRADANDAAQFVATFTFVRACSYMCADANDAAHFVATFTFVRAFSYMRADAKDAALALVLQQSLMRMLIHVCTDSLHWDLRQHSPIYRHAPTSVQTPMVLLYHWCCNSPLFTRMLMHVCRCQRCCPVC